MEHNNKLQHTAYSQTQKNSPSLISNNVATLLHQRKRSIPSKSGSEEHTMASSRWKRFAFFDRHTYTLPPTVMDDLIPRKGGSVVSSILDPNSNKTEDSLRRRIATAPLAEEVNSTGDYFSASVITASLPLENIKDAKDVKGGGGVGIKGMIGTMAACTDPSLFSSSADKAEPIISKSGKIAEEGKGLQVIMNGVKLVLVLLSSRHTPRVHIVDVTVRTNPLNHAEEEREQDYDLGEDCKKASARYDLDGRDRKSVV